MMSHINRGCSPKMKRHGSAHLVSFHTKGFLFLHILLTLAQHFAKIEKKEFTFHFLENRKCLVIEHRFASKDGKLSEKY